MHAGRPASPLRRCAVAPTSSMATSERYQVVPKRGLGHHHRPCTGQYQTGTQRCTSFSPSRTVHDGPTPVGTHCEWVVVLRQPAHSLEKQSLHPPTSPVEKTVQSQVSSMDDVMGKLLLFLLLCLRDERAGPPAASPCLYVIATRA